MLTFTYMLQVLRNKKQFVLLNHDCLLYNSDLSRGQSHYKKTAMGMLVSFLRMEKSQPLLRIPLLQGIGMFGIDNSHICNELSEFLMINTERKQ